MAKFCMKCGASLEEHVKFCKACGTPVGGVARKDASDQTIRMAPPRVEPSRQTMAVPRKSGNSSTGVIIAMALVIAALCGGGGYYYYQSQQTAATEAESPSTASKNTSSQVQADDKSKDGQTKTKQTLPDVSTDKAKAESAEYGKKGESTAMSPEQSMAGGSANSPEQVANSAKDTVASFHNRITNRDYRGAYELLTFDMQNTMGNFDNWAKGFSTIIESRATDLQVVSMQNNMAEISFVLVARDRRIGGDIEENRFRSIAKVVKDGGNWKIASIKNKKL